MRVLLTKDFLLYIPKISQSDDAIFVEKFIIFGQVSYWTIKSAITIDNKKTNKNK